MKPENFLTFFTATKSFCIPLRSFNRLKWKISLSLFQVGPPSIGNKRDYLPPGVCVCWGGGGVLSFYTRHFQNNITILRKSNCFTFKQGKATIILEAVHHRTNKNC